MIDRELKTAEVEFRTVLQSRVGRLEWRPRVTVLPLSDYLAREARSADLVVTGVDRKPARCDAAGRSPGPRDAGGTADSRRPAAGGRSRFERVLVGWKETAEARRAIVDALPFLARAPHVTVAEIVAEEELAEARTRLADVRLARASWDQGPARGCCRRGTHAQGLAAIADEQKADLIVAGAYGHSRLREWVLGGVTSDLLLHADRCSLLSR